VVLPNKKLGQHFLCDPNIARKIVRISGVTSRDDVLEIGPGKGILTRELTERGKKVYAVEIDERLVRHLQAEFGQNPKLEIFNSDILRFDLARLPAPYQVVANIPYQISSPLLTRLIREGSRIGAMTLMVQKEVARRIVSGPGSRDYGPLSVFVQSYATAEIAFDVSRRAFSPPPKVDSSVVKIVPMAAPRLKTRHDPFFFSIVKGSFAHRRKSIRNSLRDAGLSPEILEQAFRELRLDPARRGETFSIEEFGLLADRLYDFCQREATPP